MTLEENFYEISSKTKKLGKRKRRDGNESGRTEGRKYSEKSIVVLMGKNLNVIKRIANELNARSGTETLNIFETMVDISVKNLKIERKYFTDSSLIDTKIVSRCYDGKIRDTTPRQLLVDGLFIYKNSINEKISQLIYKSKNKKLIMYDDLSANIGINLSSMVNSKVIYLESQDDKSKNALGNIIVDATIYISENIINQLVSIIN